MHDISAKEIKGRGIFFTPASATRSPLTECVYRGPISIYRSARGRRSRGGGRLSQLRSGTGPLLLGGRGGAPCRTFPGYSEVNGIVGRVRVGQKSANAYDEKAAPARAMLCCLLVLGAACHQSGLLSRLCHIPPESFYQAAVLSWLFSSQAICSCEFISPLRSQGKTGFEFEA